MKENIERPNIIYSESFSEFSSQLNIDENNILSALGSSGSEMDNYQHDLALHYIEHCRQIIKPQAVFSIYSISKSNSKSEIIINGINFRVGKQVLSYLEECSNIAVFLGTCGDDPEKYSKQLIQQGNTLEGYIVDIIASEFAEAVAGFIHNEIGKAAYNMQLSVTNRYSPGYCNWVVSEQHKLFSLIPVNTCGIELTTSSLMIPVKSVSGIVGIGKGVINNDYKCDFCTQKNCFLRRIK